MAVAQVVEADAGVDFDRTMRMGRRRIEPTGLAINWLKIDPNHKIGPTDRTNSGLVQISALAILVADDVVVAGEALVGQVVGQFEKVEKSAAVIERWVNEYLEATEHLNAYNAAGV